MNPRAARTAAFSLMEVIVALTVLVAAVVTLAPIFIAQTHANDSTEVHAAAVAAAREVLETLRDADPSSLKDTGRDAPRQVLVGGRPYSVVVAYCRRREFCSSRARHIEVEVSFHGRPLYAADTVYTRHATR